MTEKKGRPLAGLHILLAEDEAAVAVPLADDLAGAGARVTVARDGLEAARRLEEERFDVLVTDVRMPGLEGTELLARVVEQCPETAVVVITGYGTVEEAVEAMRRGAYDYVLKPFYNEDLIRRLARVAELKRLREENAALRAALGKMEGMDELVGKSPAMQALFRTIRAVAPTDANVLLTGESGTGKELVARAIHRLSPRRDRPFVPVSCAALPATLLEDELFGHEKGAFTDAHRLKIGRFERAHGGTLFLDDIDDMDLALQVKLLRVLQERQVERLGGEKPLPVDIRVVAATKVDLAEQVRAGRFREDLYYRLNVVPVRLPPLRERREDIPLLVHHFIARYGRGRSYQVDEETLLELQAYPWPGNVRELENAVQRAIALAGEEERLRPEHLLTSTHGELATPLPTAPLKEVVAAAEREHIRRVLRHTGGHKGKAAALLGISRKNLWEKMKEHGLE